MYVEGRNRKGSRVTARALVGFVIGAALALLVLLEVVVPGVARAQTLICASHSLSRDDDHRLKVAARAVVPKSAHILIESSCVNPGRALGFVETQKVVTAEGVRQWWTTICRRGAKEWGCDAPEFKQFIATSVEVGGKSHSVELSFDQGSSLEHVRVLAARAIEVYADPASQLPECGKKEPKESDQLRNWKHHDPLPLADNVIRISISNDATNSVDFDDFAVSIQFRPSADNAGFEAECWSIYMIVT